MGEGEKGCGWCGARAGETHAPGCPAAVRPIDRLALDTTVMSEEELAERMRLVHVVRVLDRHDAQCWPQLADDMRALRDAVSRIEGAVRPRFAVQSGEVRSDGAEWVQTKPGTTRFAPQSEVDRAHIHINNLTGHVGAMQRKLEAQVGAIRGELAQHVQWAQAQTKTTELTLMRLNEVDRRLDALEAGAQCEVSEAASSIVVNSADIFRKPLAQPHDLEHPEYIGTGKLDAQHKPLGIAMPSASGLDPYGNPIGHDYGADKYETHKVEEREPQGDYWPYGRVSGKRRRKWWQWWEAARDRVRK